MISERCLIKEWVSESIVRLPLEQIFSPYRWVALPILNFLTFIVPPRTCVLLTSLIRHSWWNLFTDRQSFIQFVCELLSRFKLVPTPWWERHLTMSLNRNELTSSINSLEHSDNRNVQYNVNLRCPVRWPFPSTYISPVLSRLTRGIHTWPWGTPTWLRKFRCSRKQQRQQQLHKTSSGPSNVPRLVYVWTGLSSVAVSSSVEVRLVHMVVKSVLYTLGLWLRTKGRWEV